MISYAPVTDRGTGITLPIIKAAGHIMAVFTALTREWPMTVEQARAELLEAQQHLTDRHAISELVTQETYDALGDWQRQLTDRIDELAAASRTEPDQPLTEWIDREMLKELAQNTWALAATLDYELTGTVADPGRLP